MFVYIVKKKVTWLVRLVLFFILVLLSFFCAVSPKSSLILLEVHDEYSSKLLEMDVESFEIIQPRHAGLFPEMHQLRLPMHSHSWDVVCLFTICLDCVNTLPETFPLPVQKLIDSRRARLKRRKNRTWTFSQQRTSNSRNECLYLSNSIPR